MSEVLTLKAHILCNIECSWRLLRNLRRIHVQRSQPDSTCSNMCLSFSNFFYSNNYEIQRKDTCLVLLPNYPGWRQRCSLNSGTHILAHTKGCKLTTKRLIGNQQKQSLTCPVLQVEVPVKLPNELGPKRKEALCKSV